MRTYRALAIILLLLVWHVPARAADTDNPKNAKATSAGDNTVLNVPDDKRCRVHKIVFIPAKTMTTAVGVNVRAGDQYLIGDASTRFAIDNTGITSFQGMSIGEAERGIMVTKTAGDDIVVNLDDAQPVIVILVYSYF